MKSQGLQNPNFKRQLKHNKIKLRLYKNQHGLFRTLNYNKFQLETLLAY